MYLAQLAVGLGVPSAEPCLEGPSHSHGAVLYSSHRYLPAPHCAGPTCLTDASNCSQVVSVESTEEF